MEFNDLKWNRTLCQQFQCVGANWAYFDSDNSGQPLLFLHGTGCEVSDWAAVIEGLPQNGRCIALDFRGHGQSSVPSEPFTLTDLADDVLYLTDHLGLQGFVIIGHSLGGMVAMEIARRSSCIDGLILLEGWTSLSSAGNAFDTGRFYGSLSETVVTRIQRKAEETRSRFSPKSGIVSGNPSKILMPTPTLNRHASLFMKFSVVWGGMI